MLIYITYFWPNGYYQGKPIPIQSVMFVFRKSDREKMSIKSFLKSAPERKYGKNISLSN